MTYSNPYPDSTTMVAAEGTVSQLLVLVVEDSKIVRERLIRLLSTVPNVRVVGEATTVREAVDKIGEFAPDVVTLDLRLEDGTGIEVLRAVVGTDARPCMAVLSNYGDEQSRRECLALGADYFFDKSLELTDLRELLAELAESAAAGLRGRDGELTG
jgi:DNA-binding NarL/FixJ family response regulator